MGAGRPLLTHLQAQQRRGLSVFRHRGARGAGAPRGPPRERSLTVRSHTFKVRSLSLSHTGEVSLRSFRYVSRRVAFGRSELFSWNAMPRTATRQTLDKTPPCCSPLALRVKHCFRPSALPTRCFLRYFRFYGGGTRACRFLMLFSPPSVSHHFFFSFRGAQDVYFEHGSSKTRIPEKRPQALKARGKLLSRNFRMPKKNCEFQPFFIRPSNAPSGGGTQWALVVSLSLGIQFCLNSSLPDGHMTFASTT